MTATARSITHVSNSVDLPPAPTSLREIIEQNREYLSGQTSDNSQVASPFREILRGWGGAL